MPYYNIDAILCYANKEFEFSFRSHAYHLLVQQDSNMEVSHSPPALVLPSDGTTSEEEDPYYAKLGEFYSEWITLKEENEKVKEEEQEKPFRY